MKFVLLATAFLCQFAVAGAQEFLPPSSQIVGGDFIYLIEKNKTQQIVSIPLKGDRPPRTRVKWGSSKVLSWYINGNSISEVSFFPEQHGRIGTQSSPRIASYSLRESDLYGDYHFSSACPIENAYFEQVASRDELHPIFASFLWKGHFAGKLFLLTDIPFPDIREEQHGELVGRRYGSTPEKLMGKWRISVHELQCDPSKSDSGYIESKWRLEREFDCPFSEHFIATESAQKHYFFTRSGNVFVASSKSKSPKVEPFFSRPKDWAQFGLVRTGKDDAVAVVGWLPKERKASYFFLRDNLEIRKASLSRDPADSNDLMFLCARELLLDPAIGTRTK